MMGSATIDGSDMIQRWLPSRGRESKSRLEVGAASTCTKAAMDDSLDIRDVAKRTGLTSRALRFYEARGLLKPLRTYSGRRLYGRGDFERIQQILALKRAGLSLAQIAKLTRGNRLDPGAPIDAQLEAFAFKQAELEAARTPLLPVK